MLRWMAGLVLVLVATGMFIVMMQSDAATTLALLLGGIVLYCFAAIREKCLYRSYKSFFSEAARRKGLSPDEALSAGPVILDPTEQRVYLSAFSDHVVELRYIWLAKRSGLVLALVGGILLALHLKLSRQSASRPDRPNNNSMSGTALRAAADAGR